VLQLCQLHNACCRKCRWNGITARPCLQTVFVMSTACCWQCRWNPCLQTVSALCRWSPCAVGTPASKQSLSCAVGIPVRLQSLCGWNPCLQTVSALSTLCCWQCRWNVITTHPCLETVSATQQTLNPASKHTNCNPTNSLFPASKQYLPPKGLYPTHLAQGMLGRPGGLCNPQTSLPPNSLYPTHLASWPGTAMIAPLPYPPST
jgi:hypothetical protein